MKGFVGGAGGDRPGDSLCVQGFEGRFVFIRGDDAAHGVWGDNKKVHGLEGFLYVAGPRGVTTREWETWMG